MRSHGAWRHPPPVFRQSLFRARLPKSSALYWIGLDFLSTPSENSTSASGSFATGRSLPIRIPSPRLPESRPDFNAVTSRTWFSSSATEEYKIRALAAFSLSTACYDDRRNECRIAHCSATERKNRLE